MAGMLSRGPQLGLSPELGPPPPIKRARRGLMGAALVALLLFALLWWQSDSDRPLSEYVLAGPRGPVCLRMVVGADVSGSMTEYNGPREAALRQLIAWAKQPNTLRPDDELAVIDFAGDTAVRIPPLPVRQAALAGVSGAIDTSTTSLRPLLDRDSGFGSSRCDSVLVLLSDGILDDLPPDSDTGNTLLKDHDVHDVKLLVPSADIEVPSLWTDAFPAAPPAAFDGSDEDDTALAFGHALADLTGQQLVTRQK